MLKVVSPQGLHDYLKIFLVSTKQMELRCPALIDKKICQAEWNYSYLKNICMMSISEKIDLESSFAENYLVLNLKIKTCPNCKVFLEKAKMFQKRVQCINCNFVFCWTCEKEWNKDPKAASCGTFNCGMDLELYKYFLFCERKVIGSVPGVPKIRCCPKCFELIEHVSACKHVVCKRCTTNFCFVCLKSQVKGAWQCGSYTDKCEVAKPQKIVGFLNI